MRLRAGGPRRARPRHPAYATSPPPCAQLVKRKLKIDDVVDAFAVHCGGGMWGLIAASLFATTENHQAAYGVPPGTPYGAFMAPTGQGHQMFVCALVGILVIWAWVAGLMLPFFYAVNAVGWLRSPPEEEEAGMDISKHGGSAYPDYVVTASVPKSGNTVGVTAH